MWILASKHWATLTCLCMITAITVFKWEYFPVRSITQTDDNNVAVGEDPELDLWQSGDPEQRDEQCNLSDGEWVRGQPLYAGLNCPLLKNIWACRNSERPDFGYEGWRWLPKGCGDLPRFDPELFLSHMRDKVIAFVGDSLGEQQFQSLLCMLLSREPDMMGAVEDAASTFHFGPRNGPRRPLGFAWRIKRTNTTLAMYWTPWLSQLAPQDSPAPPGAPFKKVLLDRPLPTLLADLPRLHLIVFNTGHHWNRGKIMGSGLEPWLDGMPLDQTLNMDGVSRLSLRRIFSDVDARLEEIDPGKRPLVFWRSLSPRHFENGDWDSGGGCGKTKMFAREEVEKMIVRDERAESTIEGLKHVRFLNITYLSQFRAEGHISKFTPSFQNGIQDCLHWCLPGVPDTWNEILYWEVIRAHKEGRFFPRKRFDEENKTLKMIPQQTQGENKR